MKPPQIKVAVTTGQTAIRLHSPSPIIAKSVDGAKKTFSGRVITVRIGGSSLIEREKWLWCGNTTDVAAAESFSDKVSSRGMQMQVWPVGLTPIEGQWQPRQYRLLVGPFDDFPDKNSARAIFDGILSPLSIVDVEIPAEVPAGFLHIEDSEGQKETYSQIVLLLSRKPIELSQVTVGKGFHWQHDENLNLPSPIWVAISSDGSLSAGVELDVEDYLISANSSEMPARSPIEFLKAQVVAARSWLLANWGSHHPGEPYTVCGGDHCQCYYGLTRVEESSWFAAEQTAGQVLMFNGRICDARYAKSCGGVTEPAVNLWPFMDEPYLGHYRDLPDSDPIDLSREETFREFQQSSESTDACCSPGYAEFKDELAELAGLYRWENKVSNTEISQIIRSKSQSDLGRILEIIPRRRGPSGRLIEVEIVGNQGRLSLSPELEIRRVLSRYHLPSSAFWIEKDNDANFIFHGMGWGHGSGMCQIGAAGLALHGYGYDDILSHYYPSTSIQKIY